MRVLLLTLSIVLSLFLTLEAKQVGTIITADGNEIKIFASSKKKIKVSRMSKGCDCQISSKFAFLYHDSDLKVRSLKPSEITKIILLKGTNHCVSMSTSSAIGNATQDLVIEAETPHDTELFSLPFKKGGKRKLIHSVIFKSDDHILTLAKMTSSTQGAFIFSTDTNQMKMERFDLLSVGYGKEGTKSLNAIRKYFKDCPEFIETINQNIEGNSMHTVYSTKKKVT